MSTIFWKHFNETFWDKSETVSKQKAFIIYYTYVLVTLNIKVSKISTVCLNDNNSIIQINVAQNGKIKIWKLKQNGKSKNFLNYKSEHMTITNYLIKKEPLN